MYPNLDEIRQQRALIADLRALGTPQAQADADALQVAFHDEQMNVLAKDTYWSAMGSKAPPEGRQAPVGWLRGSENLDLLRGWAPGLAELSDKQLLNYMKPNDSGFRAEIYLPDPAVLGEGFRPVIAPKGSAGEVQMADGSLRSTAVEDFAANNFPQSIGMQTDYYDRAMNLAYDMNRFGLNAEFSAHSLGGGMVSAMSAVTGQPATTFNAAGLHPETARRFAERNGGLQLFDTNRTVTAYQVQGEMLNDGLQNNFERMDVLRRQVWAGVLRESAGLLQDSPAASRVLDSLTGDKTMPAYVGPALGAFLDKLATSDTDAMLDALPLAAGKVTVLDQVKTWQGGRAVDRVDRLLLEEAAVLAAPVVEAADFTLRSANLGRQASEIPARTMQMTGAGLDRSGDLLETASARVADFSNVIGGASSQAVRQGVNLAGEGLARGRELAGQAEAALDLAQGEAQARVAAGAADGLEAMSRMDALPDGMQRWAARSAQSMDKAGEEVRRENQREAREAVADAGNDARAIRTGSQARIVDLERVEVVASRTRSETAARIGGAIDTTLDIPARGLGAAADATRDVGTIVGGGVGALAYGSGRIGEAAGPVVNPAGWSYNAVRALREGQETDSLQTLAQISPAEASVRLSNDIAQTVALARQIAPGGKEAVARHLMTDTVSPSMEARTDALENRIRATYPSLRREQTPAPDGKQQTGPQTSPRAGLSGADQARADELAQTLRETVRLAVEQAERGLDKRWDGNSERLTAGLALAGARQGFSGGDGLQVGFSKPTANHASGEHAFLHRIGPGESVDPVANRTMINTADALARPAEDSRQEIQLAFQERIAAQQQDELQRQQVQQRSGPSLG